MTMITQAGGGSGGREPLLWDWNFRWDWDWLVPPQDHSSSAQGVEVISRRNADGAGS